MSRRERQHANIREEVKQIARQHMAAQGTASLSLRAIARDMELSAPALYRYFPSRDDLLTALIVDGFNALGAAISEAVNSVPAEQPLQRMATFMLTYRTWALEHPIDFQLIYGNPIPDYQSPSEITIPAAQSVLKTGLMAFQAALDSGALRPPPEYMLMADDVRARVTQQAAAYHCSPQAVYLVMTTWGVGYGLILLEMYGHIAPAVGNAEAFYRDQVTRLIRQMGGSYP